MLENFDFIKVIILIYCINMEGFLHCNAAFYIKKKG